MVHNILEHIFVVAEYYLYEFRFFYLCRVMCIVLLVELSKMNKNSRGQLFLGVLLLDGWMMFVPATIHIIG
jgi:hypothetical protein